MMRLSGRLAVATASVLFGICSSGAVEAQPADRPERAARFIPFLFIEIEERHHDLAEGEPHTPPVQQKAFPYAFDWRCHHALIGRGVLRPRAGGQAEDLFEGGKTLIILHRLTYEGQRRRGAYWLIHRLARLPAVIDLSNAPREQRLELSPEQLNRVVGPISMSLGGKRHQRVLHVEYGGQSVDLTAGQRWTARPEWSPVVFPGLERPVHVSSEVSVRFWGFVMYSPHLSEEGDVQALLGGIGQGGEIGGFVALELVSMGDMAIPGLIDMLKDTANERQLLPALGCLELLYAREAVPEILPLLEGYRRNRAGTAIRVLGCLEDARAVEPLLAVIKECKNDALVGAAAGALGRIGDERAIPALLDLLSDTNPKRRMAAATGLGIMGRKDGLEAAGKALRAGEATSSAMSALWCIGGGEAEKMLSDFANQQEKKHDREKASLYAELVRARRAPPDERRRLLAKHLRGKDGLLASFEMERLPFEEAVAICREHIAHLEQQGDSEEAPWFRSVLFRLTARRAWMTRNAKAGGERP